MSCRRYKGKAFHTRRPAADKLLLCVCGTTHYLSEADRISGRPVSAISWMSEARYAGVCPANDWCTRHARLNSTHLRTRTHCNFYKTGVKRGSVYQAMSKSNPSLFFKNRLKTYTYSSTATTLPDYARHSSNLAIMCPQYSGPCTSFLSIV